MAKTTDNQPLETLFKQTLELNKKYMNQSLSMLNQWSKQPNKSSNLFVFKPEQYSKAFKAYAQLNLEYYNQAMQLGLGMMDAFLNAGNNEKETVTEPAFELSANAEAGSSVTLEFVLENTKTETAECQLTNSIFINSESVEFPSIKTTFSPEKFTQKPGESSTVKITLRIPKNTPPNMYFSNASVVGYEPSFFRIHLNVQPPQTKTANAKSKK